MRVRLFVGFAALALASVAAPVWARGFVQGHVTDRAGAPLANVEMLLKPKEDTSLRTYVLKTDAKGAYFLQAENGDYVLELKDPERGIDSMTIHVLDDKRKPKYDWGGKIVPGQKLPIVGMSSGFTVTVDLTLELAATLNQEYATMLLGRVSKAIQDGDQATARSTIETLLTASPNNPIGLMLRGYLKSESGDLAGAEADLQASLAHDPNLSDAQYQLAAIYRRTGRSELATEQFRKVAESTTNAELRGDSWLNLAEIEQAAGHDDAAVAAFEKALADRRDLEPQIAPELAAIYSRRGQDDKAREWLAKAGTADQNDPKVLYNLAVAHANRQEWDEAAKGFAHVIELAPDLAEAHRNYGYALLNTGKFAEARTEMETYLKLKPGAADAAEINEILRTLTRK